MRQLLEEAFERVYLQLDESGSQKHRIGVDVSEPDHPNVTMRKEKKTKFVVVGADSKEDAMSKAKSFYQKKGYKVHDSFHHSEV